MPPRLSPRTLLVAGVVLLVASLVVELALSLVMQDMLGNAQSPAEAWTHYAVSAALTWVPQIARLVGAGLVVGAFVVRALAPAEADEEPALAPGLRGGADAAPGDAGRD